MITKHIKWNGSPVTPHAGTGARAVSLAPSGPFIQARTKSGRMVVWWCRPLPNGSPESPERREPLLFPSPKSINPLRAPKRPRDDTARLQRTHTRPGVTRRVKRSSVCERRGRATGTKRVSFCQCGPHVSPWSCSPRAVCCCLCITRRSSSSSPAAVTCKSPNLHTHTHLEFVFNTGRSFKRLKWVS